MKIYYSNYLEGSIVKLDIPLRQFKCYFKYNKQPKNGKFHKTFTEAKKQLIRKLISNISSKQNEIDNINMQLVKIDKLTKKQFDLNLKKKK
jgi:hypothetical protein